MTKMMIRSGIVALIATGGCSAPPETAEIETTSGALTSTLSDDSASPVHVQVKTCTTDVAAHQQQVDCTVDTGFALVGGGAYASTAPRPPCRSLDGGVAGAGGSGGAGGGCGGPDGGAGGSGGDPGSALVTSSFPVDARTWRASSREHIISDNHVLTVYAVGLRLDGVNAATLRSRVIQLSSTAPASPVSMPASALSTSAVLSGGAQPNTAGGEQFLTRSSSSGLGVWTVSSRDHVTSSPGTITDFILRLSPPGIIEGFGALDVAQSTGTPMTVGAGIGSSSGSVAPGYAVLGYGGDATTTSGPGRMLFRIGPGGLDVRSVFVGSRDVSQASGGTTTAAWSQARLLPGSHGLCNPGPASPRGADGCVTSICNADPYCCDTLWDGICVGEVTSICGRSCADDSCSAPSLNAAFWNQPGVRPSNDSYNYATNHRTNTFAQPGRSCGEFCSSASCMNGAALSKFAQNDGLIATTLAAGCSGSRSLVALAVAPGVDQQWYRQDANLMWSYKPGAGLVTNLDAAGHTITNPETADRGSFTQFAGYFCACSSSTEGQGHTVIN